MNAKEDEIYKLAQLVWGDETGQVIAGKVAVRVFTVTGDRPLFAIEHPEAYRVARMFLGRLAFMAARVAKVPALPPPARDPREGLEQYCLGCDQPSSRDCGCPAGVGYRRPSPAVGGLVAPLPVDPNAPRAATVWDPAKVPPDELAQLAFGPGPDEK